MTGGSDLGGRVLDMARREFSAAELNTALWLLRECEDDDSRLGALIDADGDLMALVLAVDDQARRNVPAANQI